MLTIDGSQGEGGGQIVRSSLALAMLTGREIRILKIRAGRAKPGLMKQHLVAVRAAARLCGAQVQGDSLGSRDLTFRPNAVQPGAYSFNIGTAGSTTLVLQTILPALMTASGPASVTLHGGTHNLLAPPFEFLQRAYLPLANRMGPRIEAQLVRPGFYPAGGGELTVTVQPATELLGFDLLERGERLGQRVQALVANLPAHIGRRECQTIAAATGWPDSSFEVTQVANARGPGNVVLIELNHQNLTELFTGFGKKGVPAEEVAQQACDEAAAYLAAGVPVGPHLADQLLLLLGWSAHQGQGGSFRTMALTPHARTQIDVLRQFLGLEIRVEERASDDVTVDLQPQPN
jgi:RNA 3'-terminal phosphate cyclase (ATP)